MNKNTEENILTLKDGKYAHLIKPLRRLERWFVLFEMCEGYAISSIQDDKLSELGDFARGEDFKQLANESQVEVLAIIIGYICNQNDSFGMPCAKEVLELDRIYFSALEGLNQ